MHLHYVNKLEIDRKATGRSLYESRNDAGLTQQDVADRTGWSKQYVSMLENGLCAFTDDTIKKLERAIKDGYWKRIAKEPEWT